MAGRGKQDHQPRPWAARERPGSKAGVLWKGAEGGRASSLLPGTRTSFCPWLLAANGAKRSWSKEPLQYREGRKKDIRSSLPVAESSFGDREFPGVN